MKNFDAKIPFDPGYAPCVIYFMPLYENGIAELNSIKNFNQKRLKYKMLLPFLDKALKSTMGFWVGCILWAVYIKYSCSNKEIEGNNFLNVKREDLKNYLYEQEFELIENYIKDYAKNVKYYTGANAALDDKYLEVVRDYREFIKLNNNFLNTKTTDDICLGEKFIKNYTKKDLDDIVKKIDDAINSCDLTKFLC